MNLHYTRTQISNPESRYQIKAVVRSHLNEMVLSQAEKEQVESVSALFNKYIETVERLKSITGFETLSDLTDYLDSLRGTVKLSNSSSELGSTSPSNSSDNSISYSVSHSLDTSTNTSMSDSDLPDPTDLFSQGA